MLHEGESTCSYGRHRSMLQNILILDIAKFHNYTSSNVGDYRIPAAIL
jgi:hypothetical protein